MPLDMDVGIKQKTKIADATLTKHIFNKSTLLNRGWTEKVIREILSEPEEHPRQIAIYH